MFEYQVEANFERQVTENGEGREWDHFALIVTVLNN